jgi:hypothetical protein
VASSSGIANCQRSPDSRKNLLISFEGLIDRGHLMHEEQTEMINESLLPSYFKFTYLETSSLHFKVFSPES